MTHRLDASFRLRKLANAAKRRRLRRRRFTLAIGCALALVVGGTSIYWARDHWSHGDEDQDLQVSESSDEVPADAPVYVPAIVDLAGDPMWITLGPNVGATRLRALPKPEGLTQPGVSAQIQVISDKMLSSSEHFMATIPSTQEDFAFYQAQRTQLAGGGDGSGSQRPADEADEPSQVSSAPEPPGGSTESNPSTATPEASGADAPGEDLAPVDDPDAGWGEAVDQSRTALPAFQKTAIANNTSVAVVSDEPDRFEATEDSFVRILDKRTLESVVTDAHFGTEEAKSAADALQSLFNLDGLDVGFVVAMRGYRPRKVGQQVLMQLSVYAPDKYIGSMARDAAGNFVKSVDPWVPDDLFHYSNSQTQGLLNRQYRLLDAIYSTAARNKVPAGVIGEAIMYLSRGQDLNAFATPDQSLTLIYSETPRDPNRDAGRVLYVGVHGGDKELECFVYQQSDGQFACVTGNDEVHSLAVTNGMITPVNGVMTSVFGPRMHPILGVVRFHKGVDWAAPVGTPVVAAFDGQITFQGNGGSYGNLIRLAHDDGRETRYAHLQKFAIAGGVGTRVKAGDLLAFVGTSGESTGPHLHFELYRNGAAIDPLGMVTTVASESGDSAVEVLVNRIVHVESGGSARAKNPLSSATGLGQFIAKTWLRMMSTYRPDLARSLSTAQLLDLRYDPTISREMVRNLAREGEAYLRARGHEIGAGRLYLCHFLGMEGAHLVLAASSDASLVALLGSDVIRANPFLTGKTAGYLIDWADRKMRGATSGGTSQPSSANVPIVAAIKQTSPEFEAYKQAIAAIVAPIQGAADSEAASGTAL
ncbi:peptidoglycan DD-metalloendopeptidase family protein [Mesorhizobium sp. BR1-1-16]|uniref:peptidoglycan DD-metalloendopeptidase family protein n=1 Tax=Mesorhizobium sp. BR1-1-16 TaxID=2876653 RepID=UPI001CC98ABD|nr:peptidoglycan DD-metalloendopeptidase family protein [Mesorhizobium sp. BR1-1-16]MBZ9938986.1 peptidoglycan DD-metalloendopeptidase family protein [Mesorhizobium sp. BR1-1-16]